MKAIVAISDEAFRQEAVSSLQRRGCSVIEAENEDDFLIQLRQNGDAGFFLFDWNLQPNGAYSSIKVLNNELPDATVWVTSEEPLEGPERAMFDNLQIAEFHLWIALQDQLRRM